MKKKKCCVAYGPQKCDSKERRKERENAFGEYSDQKVVEVTNSETGLLFLFDGNLWAGTSMIRNDPREQNRTLNSFLKVVNSMDLREGLIDRKSLGNGKLEQSVLVVVGPHIAKMVINENINKIVFDK